MAEKSQAIEQGQPPIDLSSLPDATPLPLDSDVQPLNEKDQQYVENTRMHLDSAFRSLLASRAELQQLTPEQKAHLRLALEATFTNMSQTPDYKHNFELAWALNQSIPYPGSSEQKGSVLYTFPFYQHREQYRNAIEAVYQKFQHEGGFDRESFVAWASMEALRLSSGEEGRGRLEGFSNFIYLMSKIGFLGLQKGNIISHKVQTLMGIWDLRVARDQSLPQEMHDLIVPIEEAITKVVDQRFGVVEGSPYRHTGKPEAPPPTMVISAADLQEFVDEMVYRYKPPQTLN